MSCQQANGYPQPERDKGICPERKGDAFPDCGFRRQHHRARKDRAQDHDQRYRGTDDDPLEYAALLNSDVY